MAAIVERLTSIIAFGLGLCLGEVNCSGQDESEDRDALHLEGWIEKLGRCS
jgi:hypothetical protein